MLYKIESIVETKLNAYDTLMHFYVKVFNSNTQKWSILSLRENDNPHTVKSANITGWNGVFVYYEVWDDGSVVLAKIDDDGNIISEPMYIEEKFNSAVIIYNNNTGHFTLYGSLKDLTKSYVCIYDTDFNVIFKDIEDIVAADGFKITNVSIGCMEY